MSKKIYGFMILLTLALAVLVYAASSWGTTTLEGTVRYSNGTPIDGSSNEGVVYLFSNLDYVNISGEVAGNISVQNVSVNSTGGYKFTNLDNGKLYSLIAFYNDASDYYMSDKSNGSIVMNSTFTTYFNTTYNVTFLNSSTGTAEYDIIVEAS